MRRRLVALVVVYMPVCLGMAMIEKGRWMQVPAWAVDLGLWVGKIAIFASFLNALI